MGKKRRLQIQHDPRDLEITRLKEEIERLNRESWRVASSTALEQQPAQKIIWPAIPAGREMVIVSRTEYRQLLESTIEEFQAAVRWLHQVERAIAAVEKTLDNAFVAVAAGGHGDALKQTIQGYDQRLSGKASELDGLMKYLPNGITIGTLSEHISQLMQIAMITRPAIIDCTHGNDGGEALRRVASEYGNERLKELIEAIETDLERAHRPRDAVTDYCGEYLAPYLDQGKKLAAVKPRWKKSLETKEAYGTISDVERVVLDDLRTGISDHALRQRYYRWQDSRGKPS